MNAEIFPLEARALASSLAFTFNWSCAAAVTRLSLLLEAATGSASSVYFCFAAVCGVGAGFIAAALPETKGRSPEEIQELFDRPKRQVGGHGEENKAYN